ncbi:MAG: enoyl-CoA hydratase-related protein [Deltaproteobacteria bacterium]|nr:enoyl-CoA hydratase-related protein [Deltaproteobacteria bacterium]
MGGRVIVARDGKVATVTLSNPAKKNALNLKLLGELRRAFGDLAKEDIRCVILRGEGQEAFCAGYDITAIPAGGSGGEQVLLSSNPFDDMIRAVESFPAPVIAMLNGFAFGGGLELAIACDVRIASDQAVFGMTPARLGIIYRPAGLMRFVNVIGLPAAKELFYTARKVSARRAVDLKLVNRVCPPEELEQVTSEMAREIAGNAPLSIRGTKRILAMCMAFRGLPPGEAEEAEDLIRRCMESHDLAEGKKAFLEKRKPHFTDR